MSRTVVEGARGRRIWKVVAGVCLVAVLAFVGVAEYVLHNAEPIVRKRIIETLEARFDAPVDLDALHISLFKGIEVEGEGLRIRYMGAKPASGTVATPKTLVAVQRFTFRTTLRGLLHQPTRVALAHVEGMELHLPPAEDRGWLLGPKEGVDPLPPGVKPKIAMVFDRILCENVRLLIETNKPGKEPMDFEISRLDLHDIGAGQPLRYEANLINPKPVGLIHAWGRFGPWANGVAGGNPRDTPIEGDYSFDHADLRTIKGIGGILSSTGHFYGPLSRITIDGETDTPDFRLDVSQHPVPLHTKFHAYVDGTSGDTYLDPVEARLLHSAFTARGKVVRVKGQGHDILLDVDMPRARMEDMLRMAVKTSPPLMNGVLTMKARLHLPPGPTRVPDKLELEGTFAVTGVQFNNVKLQNQVDGLSARAQGRPKEVAEVSHDGQAEAQSQMRSNFSLEHGVLTATDVQYGIPGALVLMNGVYSLDGRMFEFKGHVRTEARASEMVTGWKSLLLKPLDGLLAKNGAGVELPIEVSGTEGDVHFGLALHGTDDTPAQMLQDVKGKQKSKGESERARGLNAQADREDAEAARAVDLGEARAAHARAVEDREAARALTVQAAAGARATPH